MRYSAFKFATALSLASTVASASIQVIPSAITTKPSNVIFTSSDAGLDSAKVTPLNASTYEWWYFDAVSSDHELNVVVVFYAAPTTGFPYPSSFDSATVVEVSTRFANGTTTNVFIDASEAVITTVDNGSSGSYNGSGSGWVGSPDMSHYVVTINSPEYDLYGTLTLNSIGPAHYPCGPVKAGENLEVSPNVGWANAVPAANAVADFRVSGSQLSFSGPGYHDKNWGDKPFGESISSWFWGHGTLGDYSIVWFDVLDSNGTEWVSSYVVKKNQIVTANCTPGAMKVRPVGVNSQYPPVLSSGNPGGFSIVIDMGDEGILNATVASDAFVYNIGDSYSRWTGGISGSVDDGPLITGGSALFEEFKLKA